MVLGRFKDAVSDVAETIRRVFQDPPCHGVPTRFSPPGTMGVQPLEAACHGTDYSFEPVLGAQELRFPVTLREQPIRLEASLRREDAWGAWAAGAKVCEMQTFRGGGCGRVAIPALPRAAAIRIVSVPGFRTSSRSVREPFLAPGVVGLPARISPPRAHRGLESILALPIAISGEDFQRLPRALNMRYSVQLVKATGENIRNLDVLGVYPVPVRGVTSLRHDARTGRILVNLGPEALGAPRGRFLLARKKDDRSFVSCFVED